MKKYTSIIIAISSGLIGGIAGRFLAPSPVFAQNQRVPAVNEIRAQSFTLVGPTDSPYATFSVEPGSAGPDGWHGRIVLKDMNGRELWSASPNKMHLLGTPQ